MNEHLFRLRVGFVDPEATALPARRGCKMAPAFNSGRANEEWKVMTDNARKTAKECIHERVFMLNAS